jgi:hypothetical protein
VKNDHRETEAKGRLSLALNKQLCIASYKRDKYQNDSAQGKGKSLPVEPSEEGGVLELLVAGVRPECQIRSDSQRGQ